LQGKILDLSADPQKNPRRRIGGAVSATAGTDAAVGAADGSHNAAPLNPEF